MIIFEAEFWIASRNYKKRVTIIFNSNTIIRILSISASLRMLIIFNFLFYYAIWLTFVSVYFFLGKGKMRQILLLLYTFCFVKKNGLKFIQYEMFKCLINIATFDFII